MKEQLLGLENVIGVGEGRKNLDGPPATVVLVEKKMPLVALATSQQIPRTFEGQITDVIEVGIVRALKAPTERWRPAPPGVSMGHYKITAGTFGCVVRDRVTGKRLILSNNHVLANSNDAVPGDMILQPGNADGGSVPEDLIAQLLRFVPIVFNSEPGDCPIAGFVANALNVGAKAGGSVHRMSTVKVQEETNVIDAAVAEPLDDLDITEKLLGIGRTQGMIQDPPLGLEVTKSGRTTGVTEDRLLVKDATISVQYGAGKVATFTNQLMFGPMSASGDSGSLIVAKMQTFPAVALLYAGSDQVTFGNPILEVLNGLEVDLVNPS